MWRLFSLFSVGIWNLLVTYLETNANNVTLSLVEPTSAAQPLAELKLNLTEKRRNQTSGIR